MSSNSSDQDQNNSALKYVWGKYRIFSATSQKRKSELTAWRFRVLAFAITGAVLGTLCQESIRMGLNEIGSWGIVPKLLGWLSAASLGLATFFGKELVNPDQESRWIRSRSMAEALKTQIYLFLTNAPPYNADQKGQNLLNKTEELLVTTNDLPKEHISNEQKQKDIPLGSLTIEEYIQERINDQIEHFYRPRAYEYAVKMKKNKQIGLALGVISVILGAFGSTGWTAGWIAVISTVGASIAAYAFAGKYQYLIVSYQATADKLERLRTKWEVKGITDADTEERDQFILDCEEIISIENSAWMTELTKRPMAKKD